MRSRTHGFRTLATRVPLAPRVPVSSRTATDPTGVEMRGIIEGFYGEPWSWAEREAVCSELAAAGMDTYVYAPKDDPLHRSRWREPYGDDFLEGLAALVERSGLSVAFAVSPGLSLDATSGADRRALLQKFRSVVEIGVGGVGIFFDDIPPAEGLGRLHGEVTAHVREELDADVGVFMCPLHYTGTVAVPYLGELHASLPREVPIAWTGQSVVNDVVTVEEAELWAGVMDGRLPLLWDNVPVNDTIMAHTLPMTPLSGRDPELPGHLSGYLANPMVQAAASVPSLLSAAAWLQGDDPVAAFEDALAPEAALLAECVAPRWLHGACDAATARDAGALEELSDFFTRAATCGEAGFGTGVAPWAEQVRAEAAVALLAVEALAAASPGQARQNLLVSLVAWPPLARAEHSVFGGRGGTRPQMGQDEASEWVPRAGCFVKADSVVDRLVAAAFKAMGSSPNAASDR
jgi:hypothetical protein